MADPSSTASTRSWIVLPVAALAVVWYAGGAVEYLLIRNGVTAVMRLLSEDQQAMIGSMPGWASWSWAVGVWGGLLGAVPLWMRSRWASLPLALGVGGIAILTYWAALLSDPPLARIAGIEAVWLMVAGTGICLVFYLAARAMRQARLLR